MKGWYGNGQKHVLASRGISSKAYMYGDYDSKQKGFRLNRYLDMLKSNPENIDWDEVDEIYASSRGVKSNEMKLPKEYKEYDSRTLMNIWNIHYKMFNNISSWGGDATDHLDEMNEIQEELAKKGFEPSGEFSQKGDMKFTSKGIQQNKFTFISDAGHGWLEVPIELIKKLGIAKDISDYSYVKDGKVYLEEDSDASIFVEAYKDTYGSIHFIEYDDGDESKIRDYRSYQARGMSEEEEMQMTMDTFKVVQEEKRKRMELQHQIDMENKTFTFADMTGEQMSAVVDKNIQPEEDYDDASLRFMDRKFDQYGNIIG